MVVETMKKEHLSIYAAMQEFGINDHKIIERWERIYLEEGPEGLSVERRGRSSTGRSKKLPKEVEEDLLAEVQRLRAENDYLKNLQQVFHIMHRHDYRRTGCVKGAEQIFAVAAHGSLTVTALDIDGVAPVAACGAQELAEMRIGGSKTGNGQKYHSYLKLCAA